MNLKPYLPYVLLVLAILCSIFLVWAMPEFYFHGDLGAFWDWSRVWNENWRNIYIACEKCNYPILGTLGSAGLLSFLDQGDQHSAFFSFRLVFGVVDGLNVLLVFWIMRRLSIPHAAVWAGLVGLLPASWAGGGVWGQIDGLGQALILMTVAWIVWANLGHPFDKKNFRLYLAITSLLLAGIMLTKQLTIFSLASLFFLLAANVFFVSPQPSRLALNGAWGIGAFVFFILVWDPFLNLKAPYFSHLHYVWATGSGHGNVISGNGFNIWMFLGRDMWSDSHIPLFANANLPATLTSILTPYWVGVVLFLTVNLIVALSLLLFLHNRFLSGQRGGLDREILLNFIFHLALVNLSSNVLLTGTHERYLYHFYPFVIIACLGLRPYHKLFSNAMMGLLITGAILYGVFVLGIIADFKATPEYLPHWVLGAFHLGLLGYLFVILLKYHDFNANVRRLYAALTHPVRASVG